MEGPEGREKIVPIAEDIGTERGSAPTHDERFNLKADLVEKKLILEEQRVLFDILDRYGLDSENEVLQQADLVIGLWEKELKKRNMDILSDRDGMSHRDKVEKLKRYFEVYLKSKEEGVGGVDSLAA